MKQSLWAGLAAGLVLVAGAGPDMNPSRSGTPRAAPAAVALGTDPSTLQQPDDEPVTPLAVTLLEWGVPYTRGCDVYGLRVNTCLPGWPAGHDDLYGIDIGLSGEVAGDAAGVCCNFFDNSCHDFGGVQVGGVYNRINGEAPFALQVTLGHNRANALNGLQVGLWNVAARFNGLQLGLINHAQEGAGLQVGLWNECGANGSPLLGAVF